MSNDCVQKSVLRQPNVNVTIEGRTVKLAPVAECDINERYLSWLNDKETNQFLEVRYRKHATWGGALESVDARKRGKVSAAAQYFLQQEPRWAKHPCRFDVVAMSASAQPSERLNWIQNAFDS